MTEIRKGDRVRVTYEALVHRAPGRGQLQLDVDGIYPLVPETATVEVIQPADDPSKDPIGTVRDGASGHNAWVKAGPGRWLLVGGGSIEKTDEEMTFGEHSVIGAMPGVHPEKL